ncbi:hypothetical protein BC834DRAFT_841596 [Gloeopeniophorella convolvens]|nr:hypothetical protein BC834DRAFT_841596 [Gloeopeniophorella convolvens]
MDPIYLDGSSTSAQYDQIEIDDDDEEDQLESDVDEQPPSPRVPDGEEIEPDPEDEDAPSSTQPQGTAVNGKRKHQRKTGQRVPGHTLLPASRLENILRADGESGPMSKEAQFALSVATEEFIKQFIRAGHRSASAEKRNIVSYRDMASVASQSSSLKFLEGRPSRFSSPLRPNSRVRTDIIPVPLSLSLAFERRALKEKELIDEDPALNVLPIPPPAPPKPTLVVPAPSHPVSAAATPTTTTTTAESPGPTSAPAPAPSRTKGKPRASNGRANGARSKDKSKEAASAKAVPQSDPEQKPRARRSSRRSEPQARAEPEPVAPPPPAPHPPATGAQVQWEEPSPPRSTHSNSQPWLAGPASGFLDERVHVPEGPFGATGRTIYSQR